MSYQSRNTSQQSIQPPLTGQSRFKQAQGAPQQQKLNKIDPNDLELVSINRWNKLRTELKFKPASELRITNTNKESECFRFTPRSIEGLSYQPKSRDTKQLAIKFNFSLFSNQIKSFFGRSYLTGAYMLKSEQGYNFQFEHPNPFSLFFHSQLEKSSASYLVFEAYILEIGGHDIIYNTFPCGVGEINILNLLKEPQTVALKNTTMRSYISNYSQDQKVSNTGVRLTFIFDQIPIMQRIKHLIPESVIVSTNDNIPGLVDTWSDHKFQDNQMLKAEQQLEVMMTTLPTFKLYLTHIQIVFRESVEKELIRQVQQFLEVSKSVSNKVIFKEKKLICGFHNGWEFVNRGGNQNRVNLKQGMRETTTNEDGHEVQVISLEYSGMHEIDNVFDSDSSCIILQLEYDIEYVAQARQIASRILAWIPISITGKLQTQKEIQIQDVMLHGPGKSVDGQRMISLPQRDDYNIQVTAGFRVVMPGSNQMNLYEEIQKAKQLQQEQRDQQYSQQIQRLQDPRMQQQMVQQGRPLPAGPGAGPVPNQADIQIQMLEQQILNERRKQEEINQQILQRRHQSFVSGQAQYNPAQDYQMITWEPRNEQERHLKQLQMQDQIMKQQLLQQQRERDQLQLGLTQEYRLMREELIKTRQTQSASSQGFFKKQAKASPKKQSPQKASGYNYVDDEEDADEGIDYQEGRQLDFNPIRSKITYQGTKDQPLIVHLNQPTFGKRELSQKDRIELINQGVPGLLDDIPVMNTKENTQDDKALLEQDMKDPHKASQIIFRIFSFKPNNYYGLPKRMYLTFNFFDFPKYKTESFSYESNDDRNILIQMIEKQSPILIFREAFFKGEEDKFMSFKFEIDPSKSKYHDLFKDFVTYLLKKQLHVDIWDADTLMLYGSFKIPLHKIRRGGLNRKTTQLDLDIINPNFIGPRGSVQLQIDNIGKDEANPNRRKEQEEQENKNNSINQWQNKATSKAKIISDSSIQIPLNYIKNQKTNAIFNTGKVDEQNKTDTGVRADEQQRKMERVKRFKNNTLNQATLLFDGDERQILNKMSMGFEINKIKDLSQYRIDQIDQIKHKKKPDFVKSVISKFLNKEKILPVSYGRQEVFPFLLQNTTDNIQTYSIVIEDGDIDILPYNEFEPISDPTEWRYWNQALGYPELPSFDIIQGNTIVLEPNQKVHVLFKFMTYRNIDPQLKDKLDAESIASQRNEEYRSKYINPRSINVFFSLKQQTIIGGFRIKVEPHQQIIDHIFRYYERASKSVNITLPPLYLKDQPPMLKPTLHVTDSSVQLDWINEHEITFSSKMPTVSKMKKFNILVYNSDFRSNLLSNIQVELHGLEGVDVHVNMGQSTQFKLNVPGDIPRVVQLYSSQPDVLWFNSPYEVTFTLPPGKITQIDTSVKSLTTGQQRIQVNAVDVHSNELVHSWIIRIETDIPKPTKVYELTATACKESIQVFEYFNKSFKTKHYSFLSSDTSILELLDPSKQILGNSGEEIAVRVISRDYSTPEAVVIVFVSDYEESVFDTLKFRIRYIFNEEAQSLQAFNKLKKQKEMILEQQSQQTMIEQDNYYQQRQQPGYQSGNNFYNNNDPYQSNQNWNNDGYQYNDRGNNNYQQYDNRSGYNESRYGQGSFYNEGGRVQGNQQNDRQQGSYYNDRQQGNYNNDRQQGNYGNYQQDYNNYDTYQQNNNNNNYGEYDNRNRRKGNQDQGNNYQDYGRNQYPPSRGGGNYDEYDRGQGGPNDYNQYNYNQQQNPNPKKVKFDQERQENRSQGRFHRSNNQNYQ